MSDLFEAAGVNKPPVSNKINVQSQHEFVMLLAKAIQDDSRYKKLADAHRAQNKYFHPVAFRHLAIFYQCGYVNIDTAKEMYIEILLKPGELQVQIQNILAEYKNQHAGTLPGDTI